MENRPGPEAGISGNENMGNLIFDEAAHRYTLDGRELPGVTTALKDVGLIDDRWFDEWSATKGKFVHQACAMVDDGTQEEDALDPAIKGYVEA